jgi:hypothetical protein
MTISKMSKLPEHTAGDSQDHVQDPVQKGEGSSRRQVLALAGAAVLASMAKPTSGFSQENAMIHMFVFHWKAEATEEDKNRAVREISAFRGKIPGLLEVYVGKNVSPRGAGYETGGVMKFTDATTLQNYPTNPLHKALLTWLMPLIEPIEVDFPA